MPWSDASETVNLKTHEEITTVWTILFTEQLPITRTLSSGRLKCSLFDRADLYPLSGALAASVRGRRRNFRHRDRDQQSMDHGCGKTALQLRNRFTHSASAQVLLTM